MAEDSQDPSQKTEEPTGKRLQDAREKGQVAKSQEVSHWFMLLGFTMIVGLLGPGLVRQIGGGIIRFLDQPHAIALDPDGIQELLVGLAAEVGFALLLPGLLLMLLAVTSALIQNGFLLSKESLVPKLEKISPVKGLARLFSLRGLTEFAKGLAKILVVAAVLGLLMWPERDRITTLTTVPVGDLVDLLQAMALKILIAVLAVMTLIAGLDVLFQRMQHLKQLRMSRQEVKDEHKQSEGDPMVRARLRQLRTERARRRMMASVPEADVVIANPTHFAVALQYELGARGAPRVTAKGVDSLALRIRAIAEQCDVPVVENPPLARALYSGVDLDQEIPEQHYKAVAEIIGYVFRLKGKMKPRTVH